MSTFATIAELLVNRVAVPVADIKPEARIGADLGLRDEEATEFLMAIEDRFRVCIDHRVWLGVNTLGELTVVVDDLLAAEQFGEVAQ